MFGNGNKLIFLLIVFKSFKVFNCSKKVFLSANFKCIYKEASIYFEKIKIYIKINFQNIKFK
jgi:hypothetical protein